MSHPFVERLIGTIRCEYLDRTWFRTSIDLENKLLEALSPLKRDGIIETWHDGMLWTIGRLMDL
jgi:hypothetical protein